MGRRRRCQMNQQRLQKVKPNRKVKLDYTLVDPIAVQKEKKIPEIREVISYRQIQAASLNITISI